MSGRFGRERTQKRRKESGTEAHGLEKRQLLRDLIDVEDRSVAIDLPNPGTQLVFTLIDMWFSFTGLFELEIYCFS